MDIHTLQLNGSEARIAEVGAELQSLRIQGMDLLWDAGPLWRRHAPLLFPIVGALKADILLHAGASFPMPKHGFARDRTFTWLHRSKSACGLELTEDAGTLAAYPFPFRLQVSFELGSERLRMEIRLENTGDKPLPASLGLHPAFRWPLAPERPKAAHRLVFEAEEPGPLRRLDGRGLLTPALHDSPIQNRVLDLREGLFQEDALLFLEPRSRRLRFEAEGGPSLALEWEGFPHLGIWTKPDPAPSFLCIEPWAGHASPQEWDGDFSAKPGSFLLPPGSTRRWRLEVSLTPSD